MAVADHMFTFERLVTGKLGLTAAYGALLAEAASCCLHISEHPNPVPMTLTGDFHATSKLAWGEIGESCAATYADLREATEYGAYGVAIIVAVEVTTFRRVERSAQGPGIDIWLSQNSDGEVIFQRAARLEVSGILHGTESKTASRLKWKLKQTDRSDPYSATSVCCDCRVWFTRDPSG